MNAKAASRIQPTIKKRAARGSVKIGSHKDAYSLYTREGRKPRNSRVTVTVDKAAVAAAFAGKRDTNAVRTATVVTVGNAHRPPAGFLDPQAYGPVILPQSHTITR